MGRRGVGGASVALVGLGQHSDRCISSSGSEATTKLRWWKALWCSMRWVGNVWKISAFARGWRAEGDAGARDSFSGSGSSISLPVSCGGEDGGSQAATGSGANCFYSEENDALRGLGEVNRELVQELGRRCPEQGIATVDQDATIIESRKEQALRSYQGERGYQPMLAVWAEMDVVVADEFRDGNVRR